MVSTRNIPQRLAKRAATHRAIDRARGGYFKVLSCREGKLSAVTYHFRPPLSGRG